MWRPKNEKELHAFVEPTRKKLEPPQHTSTELLFSLGSAATTHTHRAGSPLGGEFHPALTTRASLPERRDLADKQAKW